MFKPRVWVAATIICLLYWATWHGYHDDPESQFKANTILRHCIDFSLLCGVAVTGWYGWKNHHQTWVLKLWLFIYAIVIFSIAGLGIVDMLIGFDNESFRNMISSLRVFFTCPVPYGILIFFAKKGERLSFDTSAAKK